MKSSIAYAQRLPTWRLLPIEPGGKRPILADWPTLATADPFTLEEWIAEFPTANLGVATGAASGFFVLDVDPRNGGAESLAQLTVQHGALPETAQAQTPSGGSHYLFALPDFEVTNSANRIGAGLDVRGNGGQIVIAPSRTPAGQYRWVRAPWDVPPAPAPAWLLALLRATHKSEVQAEGRGYFPPASADTLDEAAEALRRHRPAVEGDGGDDHTYRAAAILCHDFALTEDEAWPLFLEWNETCLPPWSESELRTKLRNGTRYGTAAYGCRRLMDSRARARKEITDWQASGSTDEESMLALIGRVRALPFGDPAELELTERELKAVTGLSARAVALPGVVAERVERPEDGISVTPKLHEVCNAAIRKLAPLIFARNGQLCEVVHAPERVFISDLGAARIQDLMSETATYYRCDEDGLVVQAPPERVATMIHQRRQHPPEIRALEAITTAPVFLADGTILQSKGYNAEARMWLEPSVTVDVPESPTQHHAAQAVALFEDLLCDFRFLDPADFSSWLAGLLTPLVKSALKNAPAPLICVSAAQQGAGKSRLTETIAQIITGGDAMIRPYNPRDPAEWGKRLTTFVKEASPVSVFDNVNGPIGDEGLDRLITASTWSDRVLGASEAPPLPNVSTWFATGNNIEPVGDTVRRVLMCRIDVLDEKPQERTGFRHDLEGGYALANRSALLSAALTILRAYHVAGRPAQALPSWGSFSAWSGLVRGALVWAGVADPYETQRRAQADMNEGEKETLDFWLSIVSETDGTPQAIATLANQRDAQGIIGLRESLNPLRLRKFIARFVDKPREGRRIRKDGSKYRVEHI